MGQWFQRLLANAKYGVVNDAAIQGYLRAASQLEDVWQQIDDKVNELILQGLPSWEAYTRMGYALAFVRACRMNVVFVQELLKAETAADSANAGYLPRVTYDQALALCEHIEPTIEEAIKASTNSRYMLPPATLPLKMGPRITSASQSLPLSHLQGTIRAAQEMKDWTAGLLAKYELALHAAKAPLPQEIAAHLEQMKSELELGDFHLRTGVDMTGQISQGQVAEALHKRAEDYLWEAMESFYKVSQLIAMPDIHRHPQQRSVPTRSHARAQPVPDPPAPPEPVAIDLLNQIIAEPTPVQRASSQAMPEMNSMLDQVTANPQTRQQEPPQVPPETSGLLEQGKPSPEENLRGPGASQPDLTGLLNSAPRDAPRSRTKGEKPAQRASQARDREPGDNTLDLLAEVCREQGEPDS